jgi:hypothetical protein
MALQIHDLIGKNRLTMSISLTVKAMKGKEYTKQYDNDPFAEAFLFMQGKKGVNGNSFYFTN